jgi:hypothetical protein
MSKTPAEVYQAMNATNILVAILESQKKVIIPLDIFLNASNDDKNLNVEYNEDLSSFVFELRDKVEQQITDENAEPESNE